MRKGTTMGRSGTRMSQAEGTPCRVGGRKGPSTSQKRVGQGLGGGAWTPWHRGLPELPRLSPTVHSEEVGRTPQRTLTVPVDYGHNSVALRLGWSREMFADWQS